MADIVRVTIIGAAAAAVFAGSLAAPNVFAQATTEPLKSAGKTADDLFPAPFDASKLRKYDITFDDSVSTDVQKTQTVTKIAFGKKKTVSIVTTPSGVYSSDAITSPNVRYPGIEVAPRRWSDWWNENDGQALPVRLTIGSITYLGYVAAANRT